MPIIPWGAKPGSSGGGAVSSVSNSDGTLTISPTTGSVVASIATSAALPGNPTTTTQSAGDNSTKIATDAFVTTAIANAIAAVNPAQAVQAATTTASNTSGLTYIHVAGIGDTFTGSINTAITFDGHTLVLGDRVLIKNDTQTSPGAVTAGTFNGIYTVTQIQTVAVPPILTRATDYDTPSDINDTGAIPVLLGTVNGLTSWILTTSITAVGTGANPLSYSQFSYSPSTIIPPNLGGTGIGNNAASTLTISGSFGTTLTVTGTTSVTLPTSGTLVSSVTTGNGISATNTAGALAFTLGAITPTTVNGLTISTSTGTLSITNGKTASISNSLTLAGTDSTTMTFPTTSATIARTDAANTFSGTQTTVLVVQTPQAISVTTNAGTADVNHGIQNFTNSSAAAMTITLTTTSAVDGQMKIIRIYDFSAVAEGITWVNTENSTITEPATSNGSTTLPLTVGFQFNGSTSKWRCIATA